MKLKLIKSGFPLVIPLLAVGACVQFVSNALAQTQAQSVTTSSGYSCVQRGPHSRVWQMPVMRTNASDVVTTNLQSYTELATGVCYLNGGQYVDSVEEIDPVADGAQAVQGRHQVHWAANANTGGGAVNLTTPDNQTLLSTVYGLAYSDTASGSNVMLAQIQDCAATIVGANMLVYSNAFTNLGADLEYVYTKGGLSQDVILKQQPPSPSAFGLNPQTTRLQILTEFFSPPAPAMITVTMNGISDNRILSFGDMAMRVGQAFLIQSSGATNGGGAVAKHWTNLDNRTFLIEDIPYTAISNLLSSLQSSNVRPDKTRVRRTVLLEPATPRKVSSGKSAPPVKQTKATARETGLEIDYTIISGFTNTYTFQGDTTYYLSGPFQIDRGAVFEGGAVLKFTNNGCVDVGDGDAPNGTFETYLYRPVIFTSKDDDSVGTSISGSTGNPLTLSSGTAFFVAGSASPTNLIQNARFSYAGVAVSDPNDDVVEFRDCQFLQCGTNFYTVNPGGLFENVLMSRCGCVVSGAGSGIECQNVTIDSCSNFAQLYGITPKTITNGILTDVGGSLSGVTLDHCAQASTGAGIFQTVGAASYYLTNGSTNHNAGTTNIDPELLADLGLKTTYPPNTNFEGVTNGGFLTSSYTFSPQAPRDTSGTSVDIGYHYDPIDYAVGIAVSNATATVVPGTVLAGMGSNYGIELYSNAVINCQGNATNPVWIVRYNTVQEQSTTNWETDGWVASFGTTNGSGLADSYFRFTDWSALEQGGQVDANDQGGLSIAFQNCQFLGGSFDGGGQTLLATNCLFWRVNTTLNSFSSPDILSNTFYNNLLWNGSLSFRHKAFDSGIWTFRDNLFDQTAISTGHASSADIIFTNGYVTTNYGILPGDTNDVILSNSPAYETGTLGDYYYPPDSPLLHAGSQTAAAAGLYHYTMVTNNIPEGNSIVSIGFHYMATDNYGNPLDSNGDGVPDYIEDPNGNGIVDAGEINWFSPSLLVWITQPTSSSPTP